MRTLPDAIVEQPTLTEVVSSSGNVPLSWPTLPAGTRAVYSILSLPEGSTATVTASGDVNDVDLQGTYVIERNIYRGVQQIRREAAVIEWPTTGTPLASPVGTTRADRVATATNSGSYTWTHEDPPSGVIYSITIWNITDDESVAPIGGAGLAGWNWAVEAGKTYYAVLTAESTEGQIASSDVLVVVVAEYSELTWSTPNATLVTAGTTSGSISWPTPAGGSGGYSYSAVSVVADSAGAASTATHATAGTAPGTTTVSGLVNDQTLVLQRTVTDSSGGVKTIQAAVTVAATTSGITAGVAPAGQALVAGTTSATIGTWGTPSGGTPGYTYAVTEPSGSGVTISGSGLGPWTVAGLTDGFTYVFVLTITDSLMAKGYSVVTISVASTVSTGLWELMGETDFTDGDWTAISSTASSVATPQHLMYAADGTTVRAFTKNTSTVTRTLILDGAQGVTLRNFSTAVQPVVGVVPGGWLGMVAASRRDAHILQIQVSGYEAAGSSGFVHIAGISPTPSLASPLMGMRVINSGTGVRLTFQSYYLTDDVILRTIPTGVDRRWSVDFQLLILDGGSSHRVYVTYDPTDWATPLTGQRISVQAPLRSLTLADWPIAAAWTAWPDAGRPCVVLYHDGGSTPVTDSGVVVTKCRHLRLPNGCL